MKRKIYQILLTINFYFNKGTRLTKNFFANLKAERKATKFLKNRNPVCRLS